MICNQDGPFLKQKNQDKKNLESQSKMLKLKKQKQNYVMPVLQLLEGKKKII